MNANFAVTPEIANGYQSTDLAGNAFNSDGAATEIPYTANGYAAIRNASASAADTVKYIEITAADVPFYAFTRRKTERIFLLPETYFVKVTEDVTNDEEAPHYAVLFGGIEGLVFVSDLHGSTPVSNATVDEFGESPSVALQLIGNVTAKRYDDVNLKPADDVTVENIAGLTFSYLGKMQVDGLTYLFVRDSLTHTFLYVRESAFTTFTLPAHKVTQDRIAAEEEEQANGNPPVGTSPGTQTGNALEDNPLRYLIIAGIAIPAIIILFLLFKPSKKNKRGSYNRNRDNNRTPANKYDNPRARYDDDYYDGRRYDRSRYGNPKRTDRYERPERKRFFNRSARDRYDDRYSDRYGRDNRSDRYGRDTRYDRPDNRYPDKYDRYDDNRYDDRYGRDRYGRTDRYGRDKYDDRYE
ncbi:MAG: hypothetical protein LBT55_07410 [Clostridiaceae bacterium]|nr:hypothetical protein [Clostridiaceae bacterium]